VTIAVGAYGVNGRGSGTASTLVVTLSGTPTNGNALIALAVCHLDVTSKHVVPPAGYATQYHSDADGWCTKLITKTASSEGGTVTITFADAGGAASSDVCDMVVVEVSGSLDSFVTLDVTGHANPHAIPSVAPSSGIEALMLGLTGNADPYAVTAFPTSYATLVNNTAGGDMRLGAYYIHAGSTSGSYSDTYNLAGGALDRNFQAVFVVIPIADADFVADDNSGPAPLPVHFTDLSSGGTVTAWSWDFGDGGTASTQNPSHTYTASGVYTVSLTATIGGVPITETKFSYISVSDNTAVPPPSPGRAVVEIYVTEGDCRWDEATWDDCTWGTGKWQDVTPESIDVQIKWGSNRPELGILSQPDAESWAVTIYDPDRILDPANASGPYYGQLRAGLPIRVNHSQGHFGGNTIRTGIVESMGHDFRDPGTGYIRVTNLQSTYANSAVPHDTTLDDTLFARARSAIAAAGLSPDIVLSDPPGGDPALVAWSDPGSDRSVWSWIADAAQQVLWVPYWDRNGRLGFRDYASPINRSIELAAPELVGLLSLTTFASNYSRVNVTDDADVEVIRHVSTDYGTRTFTRSDKTPNADDWADAVIADRAFDSIYWQPGDVFPDSAASVDDFARTTAVELVNVSDLYTDPVVNVDVIVLGGEINITGRASRTADWRFVFKTSQGVTTPLAVSGSSPVEYLTKTGGADADYLFPSR